MRDACLKGQSNYLGIDILLTSTWPKGVTEVILRSVLNVKICSYSALLFQDKQGGSELVSWLALHVKPRYHVSGLQRVFFERAPYRNPETGDSIDIITRFIGLSAVGEADKWLYAISIKPVTKTSPNEHTQSTTDETPCPYPVDMNIPEASTTSHKVSFAKGSGQLVANFSSK